MQMPDIQAAGSTGLEDAVRVRGNRQDQAKPLGGLKGAETARNGSSFLAMIEKMIAGSMEGMPDADLALRMNKAGRGAGGAEAPGDVNTLIKPGSGGKKLAVSTEKASARSGTGSGTGLSLDARNGRISKDSGPAGMETEAALAAKTGGSRSGAGAANSLYGTASDGVRDPGGEGGENPKLAGDKRPAGKRPGETLPDGRNLFSAFGPSATVINPRGLRLSATGASMSGTADGEASGDVRSVKSARADRRDKKAVVSVHDERTVSLEERIASGKVFEKTVRDSGDGTADMTIDFRADSARGSGLRDGQQTLMARDGQPEGQSFGALLSQELRENAADFVKTGHIVLKDNNAGLIRLTLHPESLGNVRINLELSSDRKITGKIVVSSREAYEAFSESLQGLSDAFVEGGFESAGFDLSWSGSEAQAGWQEADGSRSSPFYASSIPDVMSPAKPADTVEGGYRGSGLSVIDVLA